MSEQKYSNIKDTKNSIDRRSPIQKNKAVYIEDNRPKSVLQKKANNTGLPDNLKSGIENLSGIDMSDTKVHYNSSKPAQLNAHAYAQGTDIHIASGQEKHLPHEAWHVVQQKQGRVKPTMQMKGKVNVNDDAGLENEADVMGAKAVQFRNNGTLTDLRQKDANGNVLQPLWTKLAIGAVGVGLGVLAAPALLPAAAVGSLAATVGPAAVAAVGGGLGYFAGKKTEEYMTHVPKPFKVEGAINEGHYYTDYNYAVRFTPNHAVAKLSIRLVPDERGRSGMDAYVKDLKAKVAQIFNNKMHVEYKGKRFPVIIELDVAVASRKDDVEGGDYKGAGSTQVMAHSAHGRADARNFHINDRNRGIVGAHEIGHHLGLFDEYPDHLVPHRRIFNDHSIMQTVTPHMGRDPELKDRHIMQIEMEMQRKIQQQLDAEKANKLMKQGRLPI